MNFTRAFRISFLWWAWPVMKYVHFFYDMVDIFTRNELLACRGLKFWNMVGFPSVPVYSVVSKKMKILSSVYIIFSSVEPGWCGWSPWSNCDVSCGPGNESRERKCNCPPPQPGSKPCDGSPEEKQSCFLRNCPSKFN